jgi:crotonobetainyl-CoA:carnitine CoA-transferase CaiB-like acyl-CoA transferase
MPLSPYRVLDLTSGGASLAGLILADLGADVVLIEPPGGVAERHAGPFVGDVRDPERSLGFFALHRNQRSLVLDLEREPGRAELLRLAEGADLLIEDRAPGWLEARGLGYATLAERNPGLILLSITPFGQTGPKVAWAATDLTLTAASGALYLCGDEDRAPLTSSVPQAWLNAGADGAVGALVALAERQQSGRGQRVDVSVQTSMMMTTQSFALSHLWGDVQILRLGGGARAGPFHIRCVYPCRDGYVNFTFLFGPAIGPFTARMFRWMWEEGFVDEATRDKDWIALPLLVLAGQEPFSEIERCMERIEAFTLAHTKAELYKGALERRVLIVPLSDSADLATSRQLRAREFWTELAHPGLERPISYPGPFAKLSRTPIRYRRPAPRLDEHGAELLAEQRTPALPAQGAHASERRLPLEGLRVLDFTWVYAGPAITKMIADYGATVIRIETAKKLDALRAGGAFKDGEPGIERTAGYGNLNVGKLGLGLDLGFPTARALVRRLVRWADVVVENFTPKTMPAWELDYAHLREIKPDLIMLSSCLQGQTGPESMLAGFGTMGASLAGFGHLTGWPDRPPSAPFGAYTDYTSPRFACAAILAALEHRRRTGEGQYIDLSQVEAPMQLIGAMLLDYRVNGRVARGQGNAHALYAPSGVYPVRGEDRWIALAAPTQECFEALAKLADRGWAFDPRFATAEARLAHRAALDEQISLWTRDREVDALEGELQAASVPAHRVSTAADLAEDPQLRARGHFVWLEHPLLGSVPFEASRFALSETPAHYRGAGPMIGQHNQKILSEIARLSEDEIAELAASGALE